MEIILTYWTLLGFLSFFIFFVFYKMKKEKRLFPISEKIKDLSILERKNISLDKSNILIGIDYSSSYNLNNSQSKAASISEEQPLEEEPKNCQECNSNFYHDNITDKIDYLVVEKDRICDICDHLIGCYAYGNWSHYQY